MYDAPIGRFFSADPIGIEAGDTNFYRYVGNDPTNVVDPRGLEPCLSGPTCVVRKWIIGWGHGKKEVSSYTLEDWTEEEAWEKYTAARGKYEWGVTSVQPYDPDKHKPTYLFPDGGATGGPTTTDNEDEDTNLIESALSSLGPGYFLLRQFDNLNTPNVEGTTKVGVDELERIIKDYIKNGKPYNASAVLSNQLWANIEGNVPAGSSVDIRPITLEVEVVKPATVATKTEAQLWREFSNIIKQSPRAKLIAGKYTAAEVDEVIAAILSNDPHITRKTRPATSGVSKQRWKSIWSQIYEHTEDLMWESVKAEVRTTPNGFLDILFDGSTRLSKGQKGSWLVVNVAKAQTAVKVGVAKVLRAMDQLKKFKVVDPKVEAAAAAAAKGTGKVTALVRVGGHLFAVIALGTDVYRIAYAEDQCKEGAKVVGGWAGFVGGAAATGVGLSFLEGAPGPGTIGHVILTLLGGIHGSLFAELAVEGTYDFLIEKKD